MAKIGNPFRPYHPGELLKDEFEYRHIQQKEFAKEYDLSYRALNEVLNAKRALTPDLALLIEATLGVNADLLMRMQTSYNMQVARSDKKLSEYLNKVRKVSAVL